MRHLLAGLLLLTTFSEAQACKCLISGAAEASKILNEDPQATEYMRLVNVIFIGEVVSQSKLDRFGFATSKVKVLRRISGAPPRYLSFEGPVTARDTCGTMLRLRQVALFGVFYRDGRWSITNACNFPKQDVDETKLRSLAQEK